ncbi:putative membrane protein [Pseudomonas psychrotolerans]|nr:putative membrane protein [Pseudomonas psychrotolerans]
MTMPNAEALPRVHPLGRTLSLLLAAPLALLLLIHPGLMLDASGHYSHPLLMAVMLGVSAGLVHGVGFVPRLWLWRLLFGGRWWAGRCWSSATRCCSRPNWADLDR